MNRRRQVSQFSTLCILFLLPIQALSDDGPSGALSQGRENDTSFTPPISSDPLNNAEYLRKSQLYSDQNNPGRYVADDRAFVNTNEDEEYQQAIHAAGIRSWKEPIAKDTNNMKMAADSYLYSSDSNSYPNTYYVAASPNNGNYGNNYGSYHGSNQRLINGEKTVSPFANEFTRQNFKSEANFEPQMVESPKLSNFDSSSDVSFTPNSVLGALSGGNSGISNLNDNLYILSAQPVSNSQSQFRNNFNNGEGIRQPMRVSVNSGSNIPFNAPFNGNMNLNQGQNSGFSNSFIPAIAIAHPLNFGFGPNNMAGRRPANNLNNKQMPMRQMMGLASNFNSNGMLSPNTLSMPLFFAPNMGMSRLSMGPYPGAFSPLIYPSPMFLPAVNPYAPFFPARGNKPNKQKSRDTRRDDRDDNEDLFDDEAVEQDGDD